MPLALLHPRLRSLARGNILVISGLLLSVAISGIPHALRATPLLLIPCLLTVIGTADTLRCIQRRWSMYHGGVILCLYMDLMVVSIVLFLLLYPYFFPISGAH